MKNRIILILLLGLTFPVACTKDYLDIDYKCNLILSETKDFYTISGFKDIDDKYKTILDIPDNYLGLPIKAIDGSAFKEEKKLKTIKLGNNITSIGDNAFEFSGLTDELIIPNSVMSIGYQAFYGTSITALTLNDTLTVVGSGWFGCCSNLKKINNTEHINKIETDAFSFTGIDTISNFSNLKNIDGCYAFWGCRNLKNLVIPDSVESIGVNTFGGDFIESIKIGKNLIKCESISMLNSIVYNDIDLDISLTGLFGNSQFCNNLQSIVVDSNNDYLKCENNTIISKKTGKIVAGCKNSVIPSNVSEIQSKSFYGVTKGKIYIPGNITSIDEYAFNFSDDLIINCEASSKPNGWNENWASGKTTGINWGCMFN